MGISNEHMELIRRNKERNAFAIVLSVKYALKNVLNISLTNLNSKKITKNNLNKPKTDYLSFT